MRSTQPHSLDPYQYITKQEVSPLHQIQPLYLWLHTLAIWATILGCLGLWATTRNPVIFAIAFFAIATRQHALNNFVHDGAHYSISRDKFWNDLLCDLFHATPHLISTEAYRQRHWTHHAYLGEISRDGEIKPRYLIRGGRFLQLSARLLTGTIALGQAATSYAPALSSKKVKSRWRYPFLVLLTNGALLSYCVWLGIPFAYLYLWISPLLTLALYLATLRVIAEHQPASYARLETENFETDLTPPFTRSIPVGPVEKFIFAPINFCYHHDHHLFPAVPYTQLPKLHQLLKERGYYAANPDYLGTSYVTVIKNLVFPDGASATVSSSLK